MKKRLFAKRLRDVRKEKGLTKYRLAKTAGLAPQTVARLEDGTCDPTWQTVCELADALGVGTDEFRQAMETLTILNREVERLEQLRKQASHEKICPVCRRPME